MARAVKAMILAVRPFDLQGHTGADVTIMGVEAFKGEATVARLHKMDSKPVDREPHNYDRKPIRLDGRLDLDVTFNDSKTKTADNVKMDAPKQLVVGRSISAIGCSNLPP